MVVAADYAGTMTETVANLSRGQIMDEDHHVAAPRRLRVNGSIRSFTMAEETKQEGKMDMEAIMEVYKKLATPGAPHELLAGRTGGWNTRNKYWTEPDKPPMESTGFCERRMVLEGRFLQEEFSGEMMGSPFRGIGFTGYDNVTKKYVAAWMDTMSTGIYLFEGTASEDGRTITFEGKFDDPVKGPTKWRGVVKMVDDNTEVFEMLGTDKDGNEEKCETTYTRMRG